jgi:hypothetical protein
MRTSRPDGISQENRSHSFFIILRNVAEDQKKVSANSMKLLVKDCILETIIPIVLFWVINPLSWFTYVMMFFYLMYMVFHFMQRYGELKDIVAVCCFNEVDHIIYSNDYQYQELSVMELTNMMNDAFRVIGRLDDFDVVVEKDRGMISCLALFFAVAIVLLRFFA